ncbi:MAG: hypothetical protein EP338_04180 [Bacteroidetes bacterium]|nr:MAG: hypothetical protein EP338_04180 [Bacteroidota bacterium]
MEQFTGNFECLAEKQYSPIFANMKKGLLVLVSILFCSTFFAQRNVRDSAVATPWIAVHYGGNWTKKDLALRYGFLNHLGVLAGYKTKSNWFLGLEGNFIFGDQINARGLFDNLVDSYGNITDVNGTVAQVLVLARGTNVNVSIGKIIPVFGGNPNSGIFVHAGAGYLMHKMRIDTRDQVIPQIELDYRKGYDRLSTGYNIHGFLGYGFMANRGLINFYGGFYVQQGYTKNRRLIFFDQPDVPVSQEVMKDLQIGFKGGWLIPIYRRKPKEFYFN